MGSENIFIQIDEFWVETKKKLNFLPDLIIELDSNFSLKNENKKEMLSNEEKNPE
jgi:hypothetical protein